MNINKTAQLKKKFAAGSVAVLFLASFFLVQTARAQYDDSYSSGEAYSGDSSYYSGEAYSGNESYSSGEAYNYGNESYSSGEAYGGNSNYSSGEAYLGNESYSSGQPYGGNESYSSGQPYGGNESYSSGEAYGGNPNYSSGEAYAGNESYSSGEPYNGNGSYSNAEPYGGNTNYSSTEAYNGTYINDNYSTYEPLYSSVGYDFSPSYSYNSYSYPYNYDSYSTTYIPSSCSGSCSSSCSHNCPQPKPEPKPQPKPQPKPITGSCVANTSNANVGDMVTWSTNGVTGGNGNFSYSWSGTDGLSGSGSSISKSYSSAGTKSATVTISSDGQSVTSNCNTYINTPYNPAPTPQHNSLNAYCVANQTSAYAGDNVTWSAANVTGGNGYYTYSWSGTEGLYGNSYSTYRTYNTPGTKYAYLTVYSDGQSITRTCSLYVNVQYPPIVYAQPTYYPPLVTPAYQQPYNGVSLTQVPYTGLESNMKVILFTLALILWSAVVTYVVVIRRRAKLVPATISGMAIDTVNGSDEAEQTVRQEVLMSHDNLLSNLESFARTQNVIVSSDALEAIADAGNDQKGAETLLTSLAHRHATGEGWTTIDLHKVKEAIG